MHLSPHAARVVAAAVLAAAAACVVGGVVWASDQAIAITRLQAIISPSTSLRVSSHLLVINPRPDGREGPSVAGQIDFRAAARTSSDGEVLLTVEPMAPLDSLSGGAADGATTIDFQGTGDGAQAGELIESQPQPVARWMGSGLHIGRVTFTVHGPVRPQGATLPLRFLLAAP